MSHHLSDMRGLTLPLVSATLLVLGLPPSRALLLPFVALVPLAVALGSREPGVGSGRRAAVLGFAFGTLFWGIQLSWVPLVVGPQFPWAYPGYGVQVGILGGLAALMGWFTHLLRGGRVPLALAFSLAWVAMEWMKAHFPFGLSFPWLGLGISLTSWPELLGIAEWTGESGVSLWISLVNGLGAAAILAFTRGAGDTRRGGSWGRLGLLALAATVLPAAIGLIRARTMDLEAGPRIAVVGTHVPRSLRLHPEQASEEGLDQVRRHLEKLGPGEVDLVIIPEATVAVPLDGPPGTNFRESLGETARRLKSPLLVGAIGTFEEIRSTPSGSMDSPLRARFTNSAFLVGSSGLVTSRTDKVRLTPGMEWGGFVPGSPGVTHAAGGHSVGVLVCYESLFGDLARSMRRSGATVLVNLTSDIWFGSGEKGLSGVFLRQHPAHLVMRAVETRMGVARAANGGFSFLLDPLGRPVSGVLSPEGGVEWAPLPVSGRATFFTRFGDLFGPCAFLMVLFFSGYALVGSGMAPPWRGSRTPLR